MRTRWSGVALAILFMLATGCGPSTSETDAGFDSDSYDAWVPPDNADPGPADDGTPAGDAMDDGWVPPDESGPDAGPDAGPDSGPDATDDGGQGTSLALTGVWSQRFCQNEHFKTLLGEFDGTRVSIARVEMTQTGLALFERSKACSIRVPPMGSVQITFPDLLINSIPVVEKNRTISQDAVGATYNTSADPVVQLVAWHPTGDPVTEALPADETDPRIYDMDGDGKLAATALVALGSINGEIYVVARTVIRVNGTVVSPQEISGSVDALSEQVTLDASSILFKQSAEITQMPNSTFKRVKIDAAQTCAAIVANETTIFGGACPTFP